MNQILVDPDELSQMARALGLASNNCRDLARDVKGTSMPAMPPDVANRVRSVTTSVAVDLNGIGTILRSQSRDLHRRAGFARIAAQGGNLTMADLMISGFLPGQQGRLAAALAATGGYPPGTAGTSSRADGIGLIFSIHGGVIGGLGEAYALAGAHGTAAGARLLGPIYAFGGGVVSQWGRDSGAGYATSERVIRAGVAGATVAGASYLGAAGGAALGMAVGGPVGAAIGGMVGGAIGGWAGGVVAPYAADAASLVLDGAGAAARAAEEAYDSARGSLSDAASALNPFD